jgi:replicative DNA helicase
MSTAPDGPDHGYDVTGDDPECDTIEAGDLLDDPRTDAEALCLCSLLWASSGVATTITDALAAADFERPVYGELFTVIVTQVQAGKPHDPASIAAALTQAGKTGTHRGTQLARALSDTTMAGSPPEAAGHYAITVAAAAYRRGFHAAAASMTQAAAELAQDMLMGHLVSIGRGQRAATVRLDRITTALR